MLSTAKNRIEHRGKVLSVLKDEMRATQIGVVGSPSDTSEITIDIVETAQEDRLRGQMVYIVIPHANCQMAILGQISRIETANRYHEDMAFRGIIKRQGALPHLSGRADIRTAIVQVQAAFTIDIDDATGEEFSQEDMLGTSPGTGGRVYAVRDDVLTALLERYQHEIVYLGNVFGTNIRMPFTLRHFGRGSGGAGEAYHIGVFGKTGSGKSGLAAYLLLAYARHRQMGLLFIDPQGQFSSDRDLPFPLHRALRGLGRQVDVFNLATQVRLRKDAGEFCKLLDKAGFFPQLGIRNADNREYAVEVLEGSVKAALESAKATLDEAPSNLLEATLLHLVQNSGSLERIYAGAERRKQLGERIGSLLADNINLQDVRARYWQPALDLFQKVDSRGNHRTPLWSIVGSIISASENDTQPIVFLDISGEGTDFKDDEEIKALLLREIANALNVEGGKAFQSGKRLNCLVALDEAHRYVRTFTRGDDGSEMAQLTKKFVDAVRTTRKYGLGYMFITQTIASLHREIVGQLRLTAFGYGLTMGSEISQVQEIVGDSDALSLYKSFVDPQSRRQYPFMFTGPVSPLSFTGAPLFVQMYTNFADFCAANSWANDLQNTVANGSNAATNGAGHVAVHALPKNGFVTPEAFEAARKNDFD